MKIKKLMLLGCLLVTGTLAARAQFVYTVNTDGSLNLARYTGSNVEVDIPATTNGVPVTSIGDGAFADGVFIGSVDIPNTVTTMGDSVFEGCGRMTNLVMSTDLTSIGEGAFSSCQSLTNLALPNSVTNIGPGAFGDCGLTNFTISSNVINLGVLAFGGCYRLANITVDAGNVIYSSSNGVVFDRSQGTLVAYPPGSPGVYTIPATVTNLADGAFSDCPGLAGVIVPPSITSIGNETNELGVFSQCLDLTNAILANGITNIGAMSFYADAGLTDFTFPNSIIAIGDFAFAGCGLTNVLIPQSVTQIGAGVFSACDGLVAFNVDPGNSNYSSLNGVLFDKSQSTLVACPSSKGGAFVISNNVTSIAPGAFASCQHLTAVTIGPNVTTVGDNVFTGCSGLGSIIIPNGVTNIGGNTFAYCFGLTNVVLPASVATIGPQAFFVCFGLTNITLPQGIVSIGDQAFEGCGLTSVAIPDSVTNLGMAPFGGRTLTAITVDPGNPAYSSVEGVLFNKSQTTLIEYPGRKTGNYIIPSSVTSIAPQAFAGSSYLTTLAIPQGVTCIGAGAFSSCPYLTNITIPSSVTDIGSEAFADCASLMAIYLEGNAPRVDSSVFEGDNNAMALYLPGTMGWGATIGRSPGIPGWGAEFGGIATAFWTLPYPVLLINTAGVGLSSNRINFTISWATNTSMVVEACTNLANPVWLPQQTNALSGGTNYFSDPQAVNYARRFYRVRSP